MIQKPRNQTYVLIITVPFSILSSLNAFTPYIDKNREKEINYHQRYRKQMQILNNASCFTNIHDTAN